MAEKKKDAEPALGEGATTERVTEPATERLEPDPNRAVKPSRDPRVRVKVYDSNTGAKLPYSVPETHLDIFPHLKEQPSKKVGK